MAAGYSVNPKKDKRGLTKKQAKFVEAVPDVGPKEAARIAYPDSNPEAQRVQAYENMRNPSILLSLSEKADKRGLHLEDGIDAVKRGLSDEDKYLKAAELTFKIHGELRTEQAPSVQVSKEVFMDLCKAYWSTKPSGSV